MSHHLKHTGQLAVVEELLAFLPEAEFALREEIALKVAILAERFAPNLSWYVDVTLALVDKAGDFLSDDIWHRSVQVITNHEDLQAYAASKCVELLRGGVAHECAVKVCGYLLGEFGSSSLATVECSLRTTSSKLG